MLFAASPFLSCCNTCFCVRWIMTSLVCAFRFFNAGHVVIPFFLTSTSARAWLRLNHEKEKFSWEYHVVFIRKKTYKLKRSIATSIWRRRLISIFIKILDMNECSLNTHKCHENGYCNNTKGSYYCTCNAGYTGNGTACSGKRSQLLLILLDYNNNTAWFKNSVCCNKALLHRY